ncbi:MAG: cupin domain-containing protein [Halobacteriota archaeon]
MSEKQWGRWEELPVDESFEYGTRHGVSDAMGSENMRFSVIEFDPGQRGPLHEHNPPGEEYYMVLEGSLDIEVGGDVVEADAGTIVYTPSETPHFPENNSDEPAILLAVSAPRLPLSEGITVLDEGQSGD